MDSKSVQSTSVLISAGKKIGTGLLICASSTKFDYVITAKHNLDDALVHNVEISKMCGEAIGLVEIVPLESFDLDIVIIKVAKKSGALRIPICIDLVNHVNAVCAGYPGALQLEENQELELRGNLSYSDSDPAHVYFEVLNAPDPDEEKKEFIKGFSGAGVFELSACKQFVKLKGIIVQRWDDNFDVKKTKCIRVASVVSLLESLMLPPVEGVHLDFSYFLKDPPQSLHKDLLALLAKTEKLVKVFNMSVVDTLRAPGFQLPVGGDLYGNILALPFTKQNAVLADVLLAKSIGLAYYLEHADIDFCSNPILAGDQLKILLCCVADAKNLPLTIFQLTAASHRDYLENCIVVILSLHGEGGIIGIDSDRTSAIVKNYSRSSCKLDRYGQAEIENYLRLTRPAKGFSVYPVQALAGLVESALLTLEYVDESADYCSDTLFLQKIRDALNGTIKT